MIKKHLKKQFYKPETTSILFREFFISKKKSIHKKIIAYFAVKLINFNLKKI